MKILYAIQGTGNGHLARAISLIPALQELGEIEVLISGNQVELELPFSVKYHFHGMGFVFGHHGGVDIWKTIKQFRFFNFLREVRRLKVSQYDVVINDFEPVSAWAAKVFKIPNLGLSHQAAVLSPGVPIPNVKDRFGRWVLKYYAPNSDQFGFHFQKYNSKVFLPILRDQIRFAPPERGNHITVYLPSYSDDLIIKHLSVFSDFTWEVFSKHTQKNYQEKNISIRKINGEEFSESLRTSRGVLCGAGFETPAEALFFGKPLMVIPMHNQYEQHCNAAALEGLGVKVFGTLNEISKNDLTEVFLINKPKKVHIPDQIPDVVSTVSNWISKEINSVY